MSRWLSVSSRRDIQTESMSLERSLRSAPSLNMDQPTVTTTLLLVLQPMMTCSVLWKWMPILRTRTMFTSAAQLGLVQMVCLSFYLLPSSLFILKIYYCLLHLCCFGLLSLCCFWLPILHKLNLFALLLCKYCLQLVKSETTTKIYHAM